MKGLYYNGAWQKSTGDDHIEVINPVTLEIEERVIAANQADLDLAIASAQKGFLYWKGVSIEERVAWIRKLEEALRAKTDFLAEIIRKELGCGLDFAKTPHVTSYLDSMQAFEEQALDFEFEDHYEGFDLIREPVGIVACLTPWNFPLGQFEKKIIPAVLMGNSAILKPSQLTPLIAIEFFNVLDEIGFPAGVFTLTCGRGSEVGSYLCKHPDVKIITFTGSTSAGKEVARLAADEVKRTILELGGKSPSIILPGADLDFALRKTLNSVFLNTGQICSALSRLIIPIEMKEEIEDRIVELAKTYPFSTKENPNLTIGPIVSKKQYETVRYYVNKGLEEGARMLLGEVPVQKEDNFIGPVVFTDVTQDMTIAQEEIFGPVLCVLTYQTKDEAVQIANDVVYGLSGAVFGDFDEAYDVAKQIDTGLIMINDGALSHHAPLGGFKHSGYGKEGSAYGLQEFTRMKTVFVPLKPRR